jgi:hypothetical protein
MAFNIVSVWPGPITTFPTGEKIEILFNQEVSEFLAENSISLVGPDTQIVTGIEFEEKLYRFTNESSYSKTLESLHLKGEVPVELEVIRCDASGTPLQEQMSYAYDGLVKSKLIIRPKSFLQEKTDYRLLISGSSSPDNEWSYIGSRTVFDPLKDPLSSGEGLLKSNGYYTGVTADIVVVEVTKAGSSSSCKLRWWFESNDSVKFDLLPLTGRNKIAKDRDIYLELIGGASDAFKLGDTWTIDVRPIEYLVDTYKVDFSTAANQVKELPTTVSQSPIGLDAPTQAEINFAAEEFQLVKIEPEYGASNISLKTKQIILTFNKDIDATSVTADTIKLFRNVMDGNQDAVDVGYSWIVNGKKIIINIIRE